MKKTLHLLPVLAVMMLLGAGLWSCSDGKTEEEPTVKNELPTAAKTFIDTYFVDYEIVKITKNNVVPVWYEVDFRGGGEIKFDAEGRWYEVDADRNRAVPTGFYPDAIDQYVSTNYSGAYIQEIDRDARGYEVDLNTGADLLFNTDGTFISVKP